MFLISTNRCDSVPGGEESNEEVVSKADRSKANDEPGKSWTKNSLKFWLWTFLLSFENTQCSHRRYIVIPINTEGWDCT